MRFIFSLFVSLGFLASISNAQTVNRFEQYGKFYENGTTPSLADFPLKNVLTGYYAYSNTPYELHSTKLITLDVQDEVLMPEKKTFMMFGRMTWTNENLQNWLRDNALNGIWSSLKVSDSMKALEYTSLHTAETCASRVLIRKTALSTTKNILVMEVYNVDSASSCNPSGQGDYNGQLTGRAYIPLD